MPIGYSWEFSRWAPDWSRAAVPSADGAQLVLVSGHDGVPLEVWQSDMPVFPVAWSPDGRHLAVVQRGTPQRPEERLFLLPVEPR